MSGFCSRVKGGVPEETCEALGKDDEHQSQPTSTPRSLSVAITSANATPSVWGQRSKAGSNGAVKPAWLRLVPAVPRVKEGRHYTLSVVSDAHVGECV